MNPAILLELAARWERDAKQPECESGAPEAERQNHIDHGIRQGKRECADGLRSLVSLLS
jgi:hypothetical protein